MIAHRELTTKIGHDEMVIEYNTAIGFPKLHLIRFLDNYAVAIRTMIHKGWTSSYSFRLKKTFPKLHLIQFLDNYAVAIRTLIHKGWTLSYSFRLKKTTFQHNIQASQS